MHNILRYYDSFPYTLNIAETLKKNQSALDTYILENGSPGKEQCNAVFKKAIQYALIHTIENRYMFKNKIDETSHRANAAAWMNCILKHNLKHDRHELTLPHIVFNHLSKPPKRLLEYLAHREIGYLT